MREPSKGGIGTRLKTPNTRLINMRFLRIKSEAGKFLQKICNNTISLAEASEKTDGLVRASGDAALVLKILKRG
jgi:hypothetical protein